MHVLFLHQREKSADRISGLDRFNLRIKEHGMSMHMAALALVAGQQWRLVREVKQPLIGMAARIAADECVA